MKLIQFLQEKHDEDIEKKISELEKTAWFQIDNENFPSALNTYVTSFVFMENGEAISHVGIRKSILRHKGAEYLVYGLSEVVTRPEFRNRGLASILIKKAAKFIVSEKADLSIFTCAKEKVSFYEKGGWQAISSCFVGGTKENPFRADGLGLVTMAMFISQKSKQNRKDFENTDLFFELGKNQLW